MKIRIEGVGVIEVPDEFKDLSREQQDAYVAKISEQAQAEGAVSQEKLQQEIPDWARTRAAAQGLTLGFADEIEAALRNPLSALGAATGLGEGEEYSQTLEDIRGKLRQYQEADPLGAIGYELAGAVLPTAAAALGSFGTGGAAVGSATAARLAPTLARAAKIGATEGAIAGFGTGEGGLANRAESAALGAAIGGLAAPAVSVGGEKIAQGGRALLDAMGVGGAKRAATVAERRALQSLERQGLSPEEALTKLQEAQALGLDDVTLADLGETMRREGWRAQAIPSERTQAVSDLFDERRAAQAGQISEAATEMSGTSGFVGQDFIDAIDAQTRAIAKPAFDEANKISLPTRAFSEFMDRKIVKDAYEKARELADIKGEALPDLEDALRQRYIPTKVLHQIKIGLDRIIESETDAITNKVTQRGREVTILKNKINDRIKGLNKPYAEATAKYADRMDLSKAYSTGVDFKLKSEKDLMRQVSKMRPEEKEAFRTGVITKVQELASTTPDASDFTKTVFGSPQRRTALRLAFDSQKDFDRFEKFMKMQVEKSKTARKVMGGSETAERQALMKDGRVDPTMIMRLTSIPGAAQELGNQLLSRMTGMNERSAADLSKMLFETNPERQAEILQMLIERSRLDEAARASLLRRPEFYSGQIGAASGLLQE